MQQMENALNISLCGHFLIMLATMCFAAFSIVTVQYNKMLHALTLEDTVLYPGRERIVDVAL
jgi:hypothetical protein